MKKLNLGLLLLAGGLYWGCENKNSGETETGKVTIKYPETAKVEQTDDYFGTLINDPYRWLEYDTAANVKEWVEAQNKVTFNYLENIPYRDKIKERLTDIINYPKYGSPFRAGEYYFFSKNDGLQNQSVIYYQKGLDGEPQEFLDPNKLSEDGTVSANLAGFSRDKKYVTYASSQSGSDWREIKVLEVATRKELDDKIQWTKFAGTAWQGNGFYYSRYDTPPAGKEYSTKNEFQKVYFHKLGDPQTRDVLVFEDKAHPLRYFSAATTEDERFVLIYASEGTHGTEMYYKDTQVKDKQFKLLFKGFEHNYSVIDNVNDKLLVLTNNGAPNYRLVLVDPKKPDAANWKDVVPEKKELLDNVRTAGGKIFTSYLKDVTTRVYQLDMNGKLEREVTLPALGSAYGFSGEKDDKVLFYSFTSFTYPPTIYKYNIASGKSEVFRKSEVKFNPDDFETRQVFYPSKDGTKVPIFIVHKKGLKLNGTNPTYLYAYGGFNISLTPSFSTSNLILLENGGVYALANLRGGGEYGEAWHEAGMIEKKQNVFDDFIAAAEYLISEKYTSKEKLAIAGGSNGGLLVGAAMTQRPELFKVAFPAVGVMDMLRYHKFTIGWGWAVEYGSSDNPEHFKNLIAYSPLHNLKDSTSYPATMVTTADHDDRVVPAHSFKFAATLQEKHKGDNPVLIRIESKAGHGAGKPIAKVIEAETDKWSFMFYNMGMDFKAPDNTNEKIELK
jgi:prolyl oligopeptidase